MPTLVFISVLNEDASCHIPTHNTTETLNCFSTNASYVQRALSCAHGSVFHTRIQNLIFSNCWICTYTFRL